MEDSSRVAQLKSQGDEYFKIKNYFEACIFYCQAVAIDKNNPILYCNLAVCYNELGR